MTRSRLTIPHAIAVYAVGLTAGAILVEAARLLAGWLA